MKEDVHMSHRTSPTFVAAPLALSLDGYRVLEAQLSQLVAVQSPPSLEPFGKLAAMSSPVNKFKLSLFHNFILI